MYESIRRSAYVLAPDVAPWTCDYRALPFPEHWLDDLLILCNFGRDSDDQLRTVPTRRLDGVLQTLAPDLVVRPRPRPPIDEGPPPPEDFWLYVPADAPPPLPGRTMEHLLDAWLRTLGPKDAQGNPDFRRLLLRTSAELKQHQPEWQDVDAIDLMRAPFTDGGTAAPEPRQFQLATDALARRILQLAPYEFEGGKLTLHAVPRGPREQGAELMSQPLRRQIKRRDWWFSIKLNISLHTTPFDPRHRLHIHWGVRRWATHPRTDSGRLDLSYRQATSVYLQPNIPWLPGAPATDRYAVARLVRDHRKETFDWLHNDPAGILHQLSLGGRFPSPEQLLTEPASWIGDGAGVRAAVVHSTRMGTHEVGTGLMPHQRSQLTEWAEQALPDGLVRLPDLVRRGRGIGAPANRRPKPSGDAAKKTEELRAARARRTALAAVTRLTAAQPVPADKLPVVEARLLWQTAVVRRQAITAFTEVLGLDGDGSTAGADTSDRAFDEARPDAPVILEWRTQELVLRLRCLPLGSGLAARLALDPAIRSKGAQLAEAVTTRRRRLHTYLKADGADPAHPGLTLVEIAHRSTFRPSGTDPKFAVRLGCADAGALTQFAVTPSSDRRIKNDKNLDHRTRSAWMDGLRQLGVRVPPEHTLVDDLPLDLEYVALWTVKRRKDGPTRLPKHLPVAVRVTPLPETEGLALVRGWDDDARKWIPYPSFLLGLVKKAEINPEAYSDPDPLDPLIAGLAATATEPSASGRRITSRQWRLNLKQQRKETASFLQRMLYSLRGTPVILITHAQNSRSHWPWLQDGRTVRDLLKTGHAPAGRLDDELRLVRIRGVAGRETPQWWGVAEPGEPKGQPAGFWANAPEGPGPRSDEERVFYSTTDRPRTHAISPSLDRLAVRVNAAGNLTSQAGTGAWNPALVEIAVLGCHPESSGGAAYDRPESIALAMHQLRQAPDYPDALSLPLPLHLAGLAQAYVLPMFAEEEGTEGSDDEDAADASEDDDTAAELDPDFAEAAGLVQQPDPLE